jgi:hypothetical protein
VARFPDASAPMPVSRFVAPSLGLVAFAGYAPAVRTADSGEALPGGAVVVGLLGLGFVAASVAVVVRWARSRSGRDAGRPRGTGHRSPASWSGMPELDREVRALSAMVRRDRSMLPAGTLTADDDRAALSVGDPSVTDEPVTYAVANGARHGALAAGVPVAVPVLAWPPAQRGGGLMIDGSEVAGGVDDDGGPEPFGGSPPASADGPPVGVDGGSPSAPDPDAPAGAGMGAARPVPPPVPRAQPAPGRFALPPGALRWSTVAADPAATGVPATPPAPVVRPDLPPPPATR